MLRRALPVGAALVAAYWAPGAAALLPAAARAFDINTRLPSKHGVLLTFDDGPHPNGTPAILELLDKAAQPAVFFVSGEQVRRWPTLPAQVAASGHELGLHGFHHQARRQWTATTIRDDLRRAIAAIEDAANVTPRLYRPPHGVFSLTGLRLVRSLHLRPLLWSRWGRDWELNATAESITRRVSHNAQAGDVLLLHDADHYSAPGSWKNTVVALPAIQAELARQDLHPAALTTNPGQPGAVRLAI